MVKWSRARSGKLAYPLCGDVCWEDDFGGIVRFTSVYLKTKLQKVCMYNWYQRYAYLSINTHAIQMNKQRRQGRSSAFSRWPLELNRLHRKHIVCSCSGVYENTMRSEVKRSQSDSLLCSRCVRQHHLHRFNVVVFIVFNRISGSNRRNVRRGRLE